MEKAEKRLKKAMHTACIPEMNGLGDQTSASNARKQCYTNEVHFEKSSAAQISGFRELNFGLIISRSMFNFNILHFRILDCYIGLWILLVLFCKQLVNASTAPSAAPSMIRSSMNTISTAAGSGTQGSSGIGGLATAAQFSIPRSVWADSLGVVYLSDSGSNCVRKYSTSDNIIKAYVGQCGGLGYTSSGAASNALMNYPTGIVGDSVGFLYICDISNHRVAKVDTSGQLSNLIGSNVASNSGDGGPASAATIKNPNWMWVNSVGQFYIGTYQTYIARSITPAGGVYTFFG